MRTTALLSASALATAAAARAPLKTPEGADIIEGKYVVMMKNSPQISSTGSIQSAVDSVAAGADHVYKKLGGFAASLTEDEVEALRDDPNVSNAFRHNHRPETDSISGQVHREGCPCPAL